MTAGWTHFDHGADIGIRGQGASLEEAFQQAAMALTAVLTDPAGVACRDAVSFACAAPDNELLLFDWINAIVFEMATRKMIFGRYAVHMTNGELQGTAWGEPVDVERHQPAVEVKGATCTSLFAGRTKEGSWVAECIVDV